MNQLSLNNILFRNQKNFHSIVDINFEFEKIIRLDLSKNNSLLNASIYNHLPSFCDYINNALYQTKAKFGVGGYLENRNLYSISEHFNNNSSNERTIHLGIDIWGKENSPIFAPLVGKVHSFKNNNNFRDYGATIILQHQLENYIFYTLYGHVSLKNISNLSIGQSINSGESFANFGNTNENGKWPPHLHFQIIKDFGNFEGDYPGVCSLDELDGYKRNCPDPDLILHFNHHLKS